MGSGPVPVFSVLVSKIPIPFRLLGSNRNLQFLKRMITLVNYKITPVISQITLVNPNITLVNYKCSTGFMLSSSPVPVF